MKRLSEANAQELVLLKAKLQKSDLRIKGTYTVEAGIRMDLECQ